MVFGLGSHSFDFTFQLFSYQISSWNMVKLKRGRLSQDGLFSVLDDCFFICKVR
jgi:hypothetical protein